MNQQFKFNYFKLIINSALAIVVFITTTFGIERAYTNTKIRDLSVDSYLKVLSTNDNYDKLYLLKYLASLDKNNDAINDHINFIEAKFKLSELSIETSEELNKVAEQLSKLTSQNNKLKDDISGFQEQEEERKILEQVVSQNSIQLDDLKNQLDSLLEHNGKLQRELAKKTINDQSVLKEPEPIEKNNIPDGEKVITNTAINISRKQGRCPDGMYEYATCFSSNCTIDKINELENSIWPGDNFTVMHRGLSIKICATPELIDRVENQ